MISKLIDCLAKEGFSSFKKVSSFHNTPCDYCDVDVIDFNEIAVNFYKKYGGQKPSTVNAIIIDDDNEPFFVEMNQYYAGIDKFQERFLEEDISEVIKEKIDGTNQVLEDMQSRLKCAQNEQLPAVKTIVLTEISDEDYTVLRLMYFDKFNIASYQSTVGEIGILNCEDFSTMFN